jgi:hypothetical protein
MPKPDTVDRGNTDQGPGVVVDETAKVYDEAFDEAEKGGDKAELSPADDPSNVTNEDPPVVPPVTPPPEVPPAPSSETPPVEPPPEAPPDTLQQPGESDEAYKQRWLTLQGIHRHEKESWELEKQELLAQIKTARETPEPPPQGQPPPQTPQEAATAAAALYDSLTPEQKEALKNYEQDFDVVSRMEGIKREVELKKLRSEIDEKLAALDARIKPVIQNVESMENETHFNTIESAHPDYETFVADGSLMSWIEKKPAYLRPALKNVYEHGTAEDAISLLDDFKRETNIPLTQPPVKENVVDIDKRRAEKRKALAGVDTRRSAVAVQAPIKDDYEGAFDEAAQKQG